MTRDYGEHGRCEAEAKSTGNRCGQPATGPSGKCRFHGGASRKGAESGTYKHGGYSKYLSPRNFTPDEHVRASAVSEDLQDPEKRDDVFRAMVVDIWVRWDRTKDPRFARELRQTLEAFGYTPEEARELYVEHSGSAGNPLEVVINRELYTGDDEEEGEDE